MTNEDAIKTIKTAIAEVEWIYPMDYAVAFEKAIDALKNEDRFRWHDLRKDTNDLPDDVDATLLVSVNFRGTEMWMVCSYEEDEFRDGINPPKLFQKDIMAWKYIEPFEGVK